MGLSTLAMQWITARGRLPFRAAPQQKENKLRIQEKSHRSPFQSCQHAQEAAVHRPRSCTKLREFLAKWPTVPKRALGAGNEQKHALHAKTKHVHVSQATQELDAFVYDEVRRLRKLEFDDQDACINILH